MIVRWFAVALLGSLLLPALAVAEDAKRIEGEEAQKIAKLLTEASGKLRDLPLKVTPDVEKSVGLRGGDRGAILVPATGLKPEALKAADKEVVPLGMMYARGVTLVVAGQSLAATEHRTVEVTVKEQATKISVMQLGVTKVAGRMVLLVYAGGKEPALVTTLVETTDTKDLPLELEAQKAGDGQANLLLTVLGRYRAAIVVAQQD